MNDLVGHRAHTYNSLAEIIHHVYSARQYEHQYRGAVTRKPIFLTPDAVYCSNTFDRSLFAYSTSWLFRRSRLMTGRKKGRFNVLLSCCLCLRFAEIFDISVLSQHLFIAQVEPLVRKVEVIVYLAVYAKVTIAVALYFVVEVARIGIGVVIDPILDVNIALGSCCRCC